MDPRLRDDGPAPEADARWRFGLLAWLLALSLVLHQLWWDGFEVPSMHFAVVLVAFAVLVRPTSVGRFSLMLALEVVAVARDMPGAGSHTVLVAVCAASMLAYVAAVAVPARRLPEPGELFERAAPFLRGAVLILYAAAALAKMNAGYVDAAVSCAAALTSQVAWFDPTLLDTSRLDAPAIWGSITIEATLPILLAVPRTRIAGLVLGLGFHLVLALAGNVPFSSLMLALYVAFLPAGAVSRLREVVSDRTSSPPAWTQPAALAALVAAWLLGAIAEGDDPVSAATPLIGDATRAAVIVVVLAAAVVALAARRAGGTPVRVTPRAPGLRHPAFVAGLALLVANSLSPYLGLKTESSFTMFSNLQTEGETWNHAFIPQAVRVFDLQDQLVTVTASDDPRLLARTGRGTRMMRFELERYLRGAPGVRASFTEEYPAVPGSAITTLGPGTVPDGPAYGLVDRVAKFRDIRAPDRRGC